MRMAYYPSDFIGHEIRYFCNKCQRSGSMAAADALARYGTRRCLLNPSEPSGTRGGVIGFLLKGEPCRRKTPIAALAP